MHQVTSVELKRDCEAVQIPAGHAVTLPAGTPVDITQTLGGTYTVHASGGLFRIASKDADALGLETSANVSAAKADSQTTVTEDQVWETLRTCYDPEIPVNIVDLGLVYDVQISPLPEGTNHVEVKMTLTAPGCGMGPVLQQDVETKLLALPEIKEAQVHLVWEPPWNRDMLSEAAKLELGLM